MKQAGTHEVIWNGLDTQGTSAASGVYLYRISAGSRTVSGKMLLLR
ncbi:FlgD immunoglobulin-like domain containing protein [Candidatus Omnitrophota bacterium]